MKRKSYALKLTAVVLAVITAVMAENGAVIVMFVKIGDETLEEAASVTSWRQWSAPMIENITITETTTITVGCMVDASAGAWGAWDDFCLYRSADVE